MSLLLLLACPGPSAKPDPETCPAADPVTTGCPVFEDCATADLSNHWVVDVCGDGLDNDCDGEADDAWCVDGCVMGSVDTTVDLGTRIAVAPSDPGFWAVTGEDATEEDDTIQSFRRDGPGFGVGWTWGWSAATYRLGAISLATVADGRVLATSFGEIVHFDESGVNPVLATSIGAVYGLTVDGHDGVVNVLGGLNSNEAVVRLRDPSDGAAEDPDQALSEYGSSGVREEQFGTYLLFLPDPGGDGIPEVVIGAPGTLDWWDSSALYVFDGAQEGALTPADAVATITSDSAYEVGVEILRAGDLNGDGHEELLSSGDVLFGPFEGTVDLASFGERASGYRATGGSSVDGDDLLDVVIERPGGDGVEVYAGPFVPAHYDEGDATWKVATWGWQYLLADVDDDPESELIVADPDFGPNDEGLLTFIDFACR